MNILFSSFGNYSVQRFPQDGAVVLFLKISHISIELAQYLGENLISLLG